jgi:hypothetical protein
MSLLWGAGAGTNLVRRIDRIDSGRYISDWKYPDKGKPIVRWGRKATSLRLGGGWATEGSDDEECLPKKTISDLPRLFSATPLSHPSGPIM